MKFIKSLQILFLSAVTTFSFGQSIDFGSTFYKELDYVNPKEYTIGGIEVTGIQFLDPSSLISLTDLKVGDVISIPGEDISAAIKTLWDQGLVGDVEVFIKKIEGNEVFLEFKLTERPRLSSFVYKGVTKAQKEDIEAKINLAKGRIVTDALISNTKKKIVEHFLEKGYLNTEVSIVPQNDSSISNAVILNILVDKKTRVKVRQIKFYGVDNDKDIRKLKSSMKKTKEKKLINIFSSAKFIRKEYEADKEGIINYYNKRGFRDAVIVKDSVYKVSKKRVEIDINLFVGNRYHFRNIIWKGNYLYSDRVLAEILNIRKGDVYNREALDAKLSFNPNGPDISSLYLDNGYLFFSVEAVEVLVENDSIDLEMRIYEGGQAIIKDIVITGNTKTHDHVILRELRTYPGDKFSRADIIRTQRELSTMGYFDNEKIGINPIPDPRTETVDIHYSVVEKPSDQIELSGGWGGAFGFVGTLGVVFNNFSLRNITQPKTWSPLPAGDGQRLSVRFQANGRQFQSYSISFTEPWLGGRKPNALTVSLSKSVQNNIFNNVVTGKMGVTGINVSLGKRLKWPDDYFSITYMAGFLQYDLKNYPFYSTGIGYSTGTTTSFTLGLVVARNSLNDFQFPTRGSNISLGFTATPPYSSFNGIDYSDPELPATTRYRYMEYYKWMFDNSWFTTLIPGKKRNLVWNIRANLGFIGSYNPTTGIGPFERFIMGGSGLSGFNFVLGYDVIGLRGYADNSIGSKGGVSFAKFVSEIRYPIMNSPSFSLFILGFFEAGNNWYSYQDFSLSELYRSYGFGARVFMPAFGLLGVDWGVPMDIVPGLPNPDHKPRVTFTIGQQIR